MKIIREKPCQRLHHRVTAPLKVTLPGGKGIVATNWSLGGVRIDGYPGILPKIGEVIKLELELPFQGFEISFPVEIEVVRIVPEEATVGAKFIDLSERAHDLMSHFIEDLIRGKMATIEDTICRIDVPVTPISTKPDANPKAEMPVKRWPVKTVLMSTFYILLGISVFSYLAFLIYSATARIEVTSAVISAPLLPVTMPVDGRIVPVALVEDAWVRRGQKLARVISPQMDAKISDLRLRAERERRDLVRAQERLRIEKTRMDIYQMLNGAELQSARARLAAARENLAAADARTERAVDLRKRGLVRKDVLEQAELERNQAEQRLREAELDVERKAALETMADRRHYSKSSFIADLDLLALEVEEANSRLSLTTVQLARLEETQSGFDIRAPVDGRVISVSVRDETHSLRGQKIATIEQRVAPEVTAFLEQDEVLHIGMDDRATVFLPSISREFKARVAKIDRSAGAYDRNASHYEWNNRKTKSAAVELAVEVPEADLDHIRGGLPAVVVFSKRSSSTLYQRFLKAVGTFGT